MVSTNSGGCGGGRGGGCRCGGDRGGDGRQWAMVASGTVVVEEVEMVDNGGC